MSREYLFIGGELNSKILRIDHREIEKISTAKDGVYWNIYTHYIDRNKFANEKYHRREIIIDGDDVLVMVHDIWKCRSSGQLIKDMVGYSNSPF